MSEELKVTYERNTKKKKNQIKATLVHVSNYNLFILTMIIPTKSEGMLVHRDSY